MTRDPGNPFAYYFRNLQRKAQRTRGNALFKHDPAVPDEAITDEYLVSQLLIAGTVNEVVDKLLALARTDRRVRHAPVLSATTGRIERRCAARWS